jgi:hypothetical protein
VIALVKTISSYSEEDNAVNNSSNVDTSFDKPYTLFDSFGAIIEKISTKRATTADIPATNLVTHFLVVLSLILIKLPPNVFIKTKKASLPYLSGNRLTLSLGPYSFASLYFSSFAFKTPLKAL